MVKGGLQGLSWGLGARGSQRTQPPHSHCLSLGEGGYKDGGPRQLSESNYGHRQAGNSHWHQDIGVTAAATGDIAEAFHHLSCHFTGTALEALVGKHGHP